MSGGKTCLSGGKKAEWWLRPTTSNQCGQSPANVLPSHYDTQISIDENKSEGNKTFTFFVFEG